VKEIDFSVPNMELAKEVKSIADDCAPNSFKISVNNTIIGLAWDSLIRTQVERELEKRGITITNDEFEQIINQMLEDIESNEKKRIEEQEKRKQTIYERIHGNSEIGWKLAYQLCEGIDNTEARELRFDLLYHIPEIPILTQVEICKEYIESINENEISNKVKALYKLADIYFLKQSIEKSDNSNPILECLDTVFSIAPNSIESAKQNAIFCQKKGLAENSKMWLNKYSALCLSMDEKTFKRLYRDIYNNPERYKLYEVKEHICFCKNNGLVDCSIYWSNKYINICLSTANTELFDAFLLRLIVITNQHQLISKAFRKIDKSKYSSELFDIFLELKMYPEAQKILKVLSQEIKMSEKQQLSKRAWIESQSYRMKYYIQGYVFQDNWTSVDFYDYIRIVDSNLEQEVGSFLDRYQKVISKHRECITDIRLYEYASDCNDNDTFSLWVAACERELTIIPKIIKFIDSFRKRFRGIITEDQVYNTYEIFNCDKYKLANCIVYKKLAMYYTGIERYDDALRVCDAALACGYLDDGTKSGMVGRKQRIERKMNKS